MRVHWLPVALVIGALVVAWCVLYVYLGAVEAFAEARRITELEETT